MDSSAEDDYYLVLGIAPDASPELIAAAWRIISKRYHPDVTGRDDEQQKRINRARDVLGSPESRAAYDARRAAAKAAPAVPEPPLGTPGWGETVSEQPPYVPPPPPPNQYQYGHPPPTAWYPQPSAWENQPPSPAWTPLFRRSRTATWAVLSAIFGMSGLAFVLGPLAVWLGLRAWKQTRDGAVLGRNCAVAAIALGALEVAICVYAAIIWALGD